MKKYKARNGKAPIYARITVDGKRADLSMKRSVEFSSWNNHKGMEKGRRDQQLKRLLGTGES
ncbi:Arm DNA-binding domain-containing protein [Fulvivirga ulvae]|uniref:Arm DNA-binding domain-containing protein n=1 Tax=Fulvivirga ulvae TaxID=2904245 RepID=UPI001F38E4D3|nr:Arm DNA-binding domain-containing protein [Fulvivirga ulvae]UII31631.1 Arm DNA-binding domain-containing protein [Fulvivirga ulvae]